MRKELQPELIFETAALLEKRIGERFPGSGLSQVAAEVRRSAQESGAAAASLSRPYWPLRAASWGFIAALLLGLPAVLLQIRLRFTAASVTEFLQGADAAVNLVLLLGAAILSLTRLEERRRRRLALARVYELKSLAHVVDMHQLAKNPETLTGVLPSTASSPKRPLSAAELARYLDYCSELLSIVGKVAAVYARKEQDPVVLEAVDDVEGLASNLSRKIWQKIAVLPAGQNG